MAAGRHGQRQDTRSNNRKRLIQSFLVSVHGSKVQGFKGCILITIRYFVSVLYGKTTHFYIPINLEHGTWRLCGKPRILYEHFGDPISVFPLTPGPDMALEGRGKQHIQEI